MNSTWMVNSQKKNVFLLSVIFFLIFFYVSWSVRQIKLVTRYHFGARPHLDRPTESLSYIASSTSAALSLQIIISPSSDMWYIHVGTRGANYSVLPYVLRFHRYIFRIAPLVAFCTLGPYVIIILYYAIYGSTQIHRHRTIASNRTSIASRG